MTPIEIILIILGVGIIITSCFLVEKSSSMETSKVETQVKEQINSIIDDKIQETVWKTEDELSKLSNEKIIAVNDFSDQVMEKINQNHEEVVFLYHMLNEKESEIKNTIKDLEYIKEKIKEHSLIRKEKTASNTVSSKPKTELNQSKQTVNQPTVPTSNNNSKILDLYKQGKSVIEISKLLELGQGEVKLVIDLHNKDLKK